MSAEYVYNLIPTGSKKARSTKVMTEYQALMCQLQGFEVVNITELHGITPERFNKKKELWPVGSLDNLNDWGYLKFKE